MPNAQMKKAIDETIGQKPLLTEMFVQKVVNGKKQSKKRLSFLQPAILIVLLAVIGTGLYLTPLESRQAVEIAGPHLTQEQARLVENYYSAISDKDKHALSKLITGNAEQLLEHYEHFEWTQQPEIAKTVETEEKLTFFVKLNQSAAVYLDQLILDKTSGKFTESGQHGFSLYTEETVLPKFIQLEYHEAPAAVPMKKSVFSLKKADIQQHNGHTLYQLETEQGMKRIFETSAGERFDLGIDSEGISFFNAGSNNHFYIIDELTTNLTYLYLNRDGEYQILKGNLGNRGVTTYKREFHEEPFLVLNRDQPKIMTVQNGLLIYADIFEHAQFVGPSAFYSTESFGANLLLVKYTEDLQQTSNYYELTSMTLFENSNIKYVLEAKREHLHNILLKNRYNSAISYQFADGTLYYSEDSAQSSAEDWLEGTAYTNIEVETKGDQYFITGDDGFSWTLTRTAPQILQDENGIEYTAPYALEDMPRTGSSLLQDTIRTLKMTKAGDATVTASMEKENLPEVNEDFRQAVEAREFTAGETRTYLLEIGYENGGSEKLELVLNNEGEASIVLKYDDVLHTVIKYTIPETLAAHFRGLSEQLNGTAPSK